MKQKNSAGETNAKEEIYHRTLLTAAVRMYTQGCYEEDPGTVKQKKILKPVFALNEKQDGTGEIYESGRWSLGADIDIESFFGLSTEAKLIMLGKFLDRSWYALIGGFALILPMLIMKLYPTTLSVCLTTTLSVILVGQVLATLAKDINSILTLTAAYAAVLVVFVGTATTDHHSSSTRDAEIMIVVCGGLFVLILLLRWLEQRWIRALFRKWLGQHGLAGFINSGFENCYLKAFTAAREKLNHIR